jgi:hypothetical protein
MRTTFRVDKTEFQRDFKKLASETKRSLPLFINSRMLAIAKSAREGTPEANRGSMAAYLGATIKSERVNSNGRTVRRFNYRPTPVVYAIVNARRKKAGIAPVPRGQMADEAKKFIASKFRAVGSMKSGWTMAIGILAQAVSQSLGSMGGPRVRMASRAKKAVDGWSPGATVEYRETVERAGIRFIDARVEASLDAAFDKEHGEILRHLDKHMNNVAAKVGAK